MDTKYSQMALKEASERLKNLPEMLSEIDELLKGHNFGNPDQASLVRSKIEYLHLLISLKNSSEIELEDYATRVESRITN